MNSLISGGRALVRPCAGAGERPARGRQSQESVKPKRYTVPTSGTREHQTSMLPTTCSRLASTTPAFHTRLLPRGERDFGARLARRRPPATGHFIQDELM